MRNPETKGFVSWADVMTAWRYIEAGLAVDLELRTRVKCPVGEQRNKLYCELVAYDKSGERVPTVVRILGSFPSSNAATYPGMLLGMLYKAEAELMGVRVWVEPTIARKPRADLPGYA